jgi:hypothetical protein
MTTETITETTPQTTGLSIQDIQNLLIVVDLATQRGAFRAAEMSQVGSLFDRVNTFLTSVAPPATPANEVEG